MFLNALDGVRGSSGAGLRVPAYVLGITAIGAILGGSTVFYPLTGMDAPTFVYFGEAVLRGEALYRGVWDIVAPGTFLAYAAGMAVLGHSGYAVRLVDVLWQVATALLLGRGAVAVSGRKGSDWVSGIAYLCCYYSLHFSSWGEPDGFVTLPLAAAFLYMLRAFREDRWRDWALAAVFVGVAIVFKLPYGLFGVAMMVAAAVQERRTYRAIATRLAAMAAGVLVPTGACALYLAAGGGLGDFVRGHLTVAMEYAARNRALISPACIAGFLARRAHWPLYILGGCWMAARAAAMRVGAGLRREEILLVAWLGISVFSIVLHGAYFAYHFSPAAAPLAVLAGIVPVPLERSSPRARRVSYALALLATLPFLAVPVRELGRRALFEDAADSWTRHSEFQAVIEAIRSATTPGQTITVWGPEVSIYLHSQRRSATRFPNSFMLHVEWQGDDLRRTFLEDFRAHPPEVFVAQKIGGARCYWYVKPPDALHSFSALQDILRAEYVPLLETEGFVVLRRARSRQEVSYGKRMETPESLPAYTAWAISTARAPSSPVAASVFSPRTARAKQSISGTKLCCTVQ
jgi:hypothetical protein